LDDKDKDKEQVGNVPIGWEHFEDSDSDLVGDSNSKKTSKPDVREDGWAIPFACPITPWIFYPPPLDNVHGNQDSPR
jgi:hypothetical protein